MGLFKLGQCERDQHAEEDDEASFVAPLQVLGLHPSTNADKDDGRQ